ncbi:MAG: hypothetical protein AAFP13_06030 [Pseudomonadota bacterium]
MSNNDNSLIIFFNGLGIVVAYVMLALSLYLSTDVPLSTKGFWGIAVLMLTLSLVNFVKFRFDAQSAEDRIAQLEAARNEKLLKEYVDSEE